MNERNISSYGVIDTPNVEIIDKDKVSNLKERYLKENNIDFEAGNIDSTFFNHIWQLTRSNSLV